MPECRAWFAALVSVRGMNWPLFMPVITIFAGAGEFGLLHLIWLRLPLLPRPAFERSGLTRPIEADEFTRISRLCDGWDTCQRLRVLEIKLWHSVADRFVLFWEIKFGTLMVHEKQWKTIEQHNMIWWFSTCFPGKGQGQLRVIRLDCE